MQQIRTDDDIKQLGTILSIGAHPDDESFTSAGIIATAVKNGQKVVCLTATRGEAGVQDESRWPADKLGEIREKELKNSLEILGVKDSILLDFRDGECQNVPLLEGASHIITAIQEHQPDTILTFGPDGLTGHTDHRAISNWVTEAIKASAKEIKVFHVVVEAELYENHIIEIDEQFNIFFNIDEPPLKSANECVIYYHLPPAVLEIKKKALLAQASQMERMYSNASPETLASMLGSECFVLSE